MKTMMAVLGLVAVAGLAGCASPGQVMRNTPTETINSSRKADAVIACIMPKLRVEWPATKVSPTNSSQAIVVSASGSGAAIAVVIVTAAASGSLVSLHRGPHLTTPWRIADSISHSIKNTVHACT